MSLENAGFEDGTLKGYGRHGRIAILERIKAKNGDVIPSRSGRWCACVDDPLAIDRGGRRLPPQSNEDLPADMRSITYPDGLGGVTRGTDGAILTRKIKLKAHETLVFWWAFLGWGQTPANDFSFFQARAREAQTVGTAGAASNDPLVNDFLVDLVELDRRGMPYQDWTRYTWTAIADFDGEVTWICGNGFSMQRNAAELPPRAWANPSALLIDGISIE